MLALHVAVFLFGLSGLFSKFIHAPVVVVVWGRSTFAVITILCYQLARQERIPVPWRSQGLMQLFGQGMLLALHWVTFFYAIKLI